MKRNLLSLEDYSSEEIQQILDLTASLKATRGTMGTDLHGKSIGLLFQKSSNRTRVSFEVGVHELGGNCVYLSPDEIKLGVRESITDVAKTLSRYLSGIVARTHSHADLMELAQESSVLVINGLSDVYHPCQALTDLFSIREKLGDLKGLKLAYVGDGNNVCHSLLLGCARMGMHMHVATPVDYAPNPEVVALAVKAAEASQGSVVIDISPEKAVVDANVIYSDVWVSMGQEVEAHQRLTDFSNFQINQDLLVTAKSDYIFMHCLPAHRGQEVTEGVIDGPNSIVFDQAENRLHTQKAILTFLLRSAS